MPWRAICCANVSSPGCDLLLLWLLLQWLWLPCLPCLRTWNVLVVVEAMVVVLLQVAVKGRVLSWGDAQSHSGRGLCCRQRQEMVAVWAQAQPGAGGGGCGGPAAGAVLLLVLRGAWQHVWPWDRARPGLLLRVLIVGVVVVVSLLRLLVLVLLPLLLAVAGSPSLCPPPAASPLLLLLRHVLLQQSPQDGVLQQSPQDGVLQQIRLGVGASSGGMVRLQQLQQLLELEQLAQLALLLVLLKPPWLLLLLLLGRWCHLQPVVLGAVGSVVHWLLWWHARSAMPQLFGALWGVGCCWPGVLWNLHGATGQDARAALLLLLLLLLPVQWWVTAGQRHLIVCVGLQLARWLGATLACSAEEAWHACEWRATVESFTYALFVV
jgi:hypothetical protein